MTVPETESSDPATAELDAWGDHAILQVLWQGQLAAAAAVGPALPAIAAAAGAAVGRLESGGRLAYAGAGTSGRIAAQDGAELLPTFDWPEDRLLLLVAGGAAALLRAVENAEDEAGQATRLIADHALDACDVLIAVAASGATPFTLACLDAAKEAGALTIGIANSPDAPLLQQADHAILVQTGAEPIAGSTRMKAGTAQKIVLNLLSTLLMLRLGRVYRGQMVDMRAGNAKLRARAERMLAGLTGCTDVAARMALAAADGKVKLALLLLEGLDRTAAEALLARHHGRIRPALAELHASR
ncbi:MAG TPA: N-acetylmuramic acid 6-phosphate etherase [Acetobacteraceae bacterium]|nr:N-acetylmuramic acid 6-phosphate etherase [Acetobacteraceae bacterium]